MGKSERIQDLFEKLGNIGPKEKETIEISKIISDVIGMLLDARISKGMTQRDLADRSGIKQSAIARMEKMNVIPRLDTLVKVAYHLGVKIQFEDKLNEVQYCAIISNPTITVESTTYYFENDQNSFDSPKPEIIYKAKPQWGCNL
jgi:transcriptional regulator with XRE-family HTH domain